MLLNPLAFGKLAELVAVEAARRFVIDVFHTGLFGVTQPRGETPAVTH